MTTGQHEARVEIVIRAWRERADDHNGEIRGSIATLARDAPQPFIGIAQMIDRLTTLIEELLPEGPPR